MLYNTPEATSPPQNNKIWIESNFVLDFIWAQEKEGRKASIKGDL